MKIVFIIQWKDIVGNKTDLAGKIKDMLNSLFSDVSGNSFSFIDADNIPHLLDYQLSEKDRKAYFQIISAESEARAARTLSCIREKISKGQHRKDVLIICSYDEASLSYCCRLMKPMGIFERHLRELMYLITTKAFGVDWVEKTFPEEMINGIKERTKGRLNKEKITESAFEFLDYGEITSYLFSQRYFDCLPEQLIEEKLSDQSLKKLSKDEIIAIISSHRKSTLWDKLFSNINGISKETIGKIREYRNDVMHHHTLNDTNYKEIQKEVKIADKIIIQAIADIENKIYTEEDAKNVFSSIGYALSEMMKTINYTVKLNIPDITSSIESVFKNLSEICNSYYSKIDFSSMATILSDTLSRLPDYLQLINNTAIANLPLNDSIEIENIPDNSESDEDENDVKS